MQSSNKVTSSGGKFELVADLPPREFVGENTVSAMRLRGTPALRLGRDFDDMVSEN